MVKLCLPFASTFSLTSSHIDPNLQKTLTKKPMSGSNNTPIIHLQIGGVWSLFSAKDYVLPTKVQQVNTHCLYLSLYY
jgi:hypothetical protein